MDGYLDTKSYPYTQPCTRFLTVKLVREFMDDWTALVGDKRRCSRLLKSVLCLVQSLQPSYENIFQETSQKKQTKPYVRTATVRNRNTIYILLRL